MQMKNLKLVTAFLSVSAVALTAGCSSAPGPATGTGGSSGGGGSTGTAEGVDLVPSETGYLDPTKNSLGIKGSWYAYGDGIGSNGMPPGDCQKAGHPDAACSKITSPSPGSFPPTNGKMCTTGMVTPVIDIVGMAGSPDYSKIWGAGIGVDLNNDGIAPKAAFDASALLGFSFDLDMKPPGGIRVEAQTTDTDGGEAGNAYWGATASYLPSPVAVGTNTVKWTDLVGPKDGKTINPAHLEGLQFHVPTVTGSGGSYSFCISNLKMLKMKK